jgi:hypothetical protein
MNLKLKTHDGSYFNISETFNDLGFSVGGVDIDLDIIERSFTPGAFAIGERRIKSSMLKLTADIKADSDADFKDSANEVLYYAKNAEYIEDDDNSIRAKIELSNFILTPMDEVGTFYRYEKLEMTFSMLTPYWEKTTLETESFTDSSKVIALNNQGYLPTPPEFTIESSAACDSFSFWITENQQGIEINDLSFGTDTTLDTYTVDNFNGVVTLGDNETNRNDRISNNTGFFEFPVGSSTLNFVASVSVDVTISYRERYYI